MFSILLPLLSLLLLLLLLLFLLLFILLFLLQSMFGQGNIIFLQSQVTGKFVQINNGEVGANGAQDDTSEWMNSEQEEEEEEEEGKEEEEEGD